MPRSSRLSRSCSSLRRSRGDGVGVVGLEELTALVLDVGAAHGQGADIALAAGFDVGQFLEQVLLD